MGVLTYIIIVVNLTVRNTHFVKKNMLFSSVQSNMAQPYLALSGSPASRLTSGCEYMLCTWEQGRPSSISSGTAPSIALFSDSPGRVHMCGSLGMRLHPISSEAQPHLASFPCVQTHNNLGMRLWATTVCGHNIILSVPWSHMPVTKAVTVVHTYFSP